MANRPHELWHLLAAFTAWSVMFAAIYAVQALGCAYNWNEVALGPIDLHRALLVATYVGALAVVAGVAVWQRRLAAEAGATGFLRSAGLLASLAALGATALIFLPVVAISACR